MLNKKLQNEIDKLRNSNKSVTDGDIKTLLKLIDGEVSSIEKMDFCDQFIKKIFGNIYSDDVLVPLKFWDSEVGRAVLKIKYGFQGREIYFVKEIAEAIGKTRQYINQEINDGNLKGYKRDGKVIVYKHDLDKYLQKKGMEKNLYGEIEEKIIVPRSEREEKYGEE